MGAVEILTPIAAVVGASAWLPQIVKWCGKKKVSGKIITRYHMLKEGKSIFLFKIAILIRNKPFNLKDITYDIFDSDDNQFSARPVNMRLLVYKFGGKDSKLLVRGNEYLNNEVFLPADVGRVGYLIYRFHENLDRRLTKTRFTLLDMSGKEKTIDIPESDLKEEDLLFDDTIWGRVSVDDWKLLSGSATG